jgi:hypothetical protein
MVYKSHLIKIDDLVEVTYYVTYLIKGKERLILRKCRGVCIERYALYNSKEIIKLKIYFKKSIAWMSFNLNSPLIVNINLL